MREQVRRGILVALAVAGVLLAWGLVSAFRARADINRARDRLAALQHGGTKAGATAALDAARRDLRRARSAMAEPGPAIVARVPLLGRSWVAIRVVDAAALSVVEAAREIVPALDSDLVGNKRIDLPKLTRVEALTRSAAEDVAPSLRRLARLRTGWAPPQVRANVRKAQDQLGPARDALTRAADLTAAMHGLLGGNGDRRLLIVLENNAELRGAGGLVSVFAEATARNGAVDVGPFRDLVDVAESRDFARPVPAPADYVARYGRFLANTTLWRNANMSPDIPTVSTVMSELAVLSLKHPIDSVLTLDVPAIADVLDATGPARLADGRTISASTAVDELLSRAYVGVPDTVAGQKERRRRLRVAADAVVHRLFDGDAPVLSLASALGRAAGGRHLALWSAHPDEQRALESAQASGSVRDDTADIAMVTIQNFGGGQNEGNKLDYYARLATTVKVRVGRTSALTERTYRLRNTAPSTGLSGYVAGLEHPGEMRDLIDIAIPRNAGVESFTRNGEEVALDRQQEGDHDVLEDVASLSPGTEVTYTVRYRTPLEGSGYSLRLVPQPMPFAPTLSLRVRDDQVAFFRDVQGRLSYDGTFGSERVVRIRTVRGDLWHRLGRAVQHWWDSPVRL